MTHIYNDTFFDYIDGGARSSAKALIGLANSWIKPRSVLDLGCGRGVWLDEWHAAGVGRVHGVDGAYVNRETLAIPRDSFQVADLTKPLTFDAKFDLAQSLEVGEHLPTSASDTLVDSLCNSANRIVFSAAVVGQGGEFHVNEQPLSFWQEKFAARGFHAYDCLRPYLKSNSAVEPWYRYNAVFYANEAGAQDLPKEITQYALPEGELVRNGGDLKWRCRKALVGRLPQGAVTQIAQLRAARLAAKAVKTSDPKRVAG